MATLYRSMQLTAAARAKTVAPITRDLLNLPDRTLAVPTRAAGTPRRVGCVRDKCLEAGRIEAQGA